MEYPVLVAGEGGRFAVHFTRLDNFRPMKTGKVEVRLEGPGGTETFSSPSAFAARNLRSGRETLQTRRPTT